MIPSQLMQSHQNSLSYSHNCIFRNEGGSAPACGWHKPDKNWPRSPAPSVCNDAAAKTGLWPTRTRERTESGPVASCKKNAQKRKSTQTGVVWPKITGL